jgi:negative regulator of flagellin synthesis FlgM
MEIGKVDKYYKTQLSKSKSKAKTEAKSSAKAQDSVEFSSELQSINILKNKMETTPDVRTEKVESIKAKLESGEYSVNTEEVAQKIIDEMV